MLATSIPLSFRDLLVIWYIRVVLSILVTAPIAWIGTSMSGYEVLRTLRLSKVKTPILILSGMAGIEDKVRGLGFGADDYMTKPFHKDELVARIHAIVRRSKGHGCDLGHFAGALRPA